VLGNLKYSFYFVGITLSGLRRHHFWACLFLSFITSELITKMKTPTAVLLLQIVTSFISNASQQCRNTGDSHHGLVLLDYVYKSFKVDRLATCYSARNVEPACQSLNYDLADKTCEFNSAFKNIEDLTETPTSVYAVNPDRGKPLFCDTAPLLAYLNYNSLTK